MAAVRLVSRLGWSTPPSAQNVPSNPDLCAKTLTLQLANATDWLSVKQLDDEARSAAGRGQRIHIDCHNVTSLDLGSLQLLRRLLDDFPQTQLAFASEQEAGIWQGWLHLMDRRKETSVR